MNLANLNLSEWTCISVIVAMAILVIKTINQPLTHFFNSINPVRKYYALNDIRRRLETLELENIELRYQISQINKVKEKTSIKRPRK